MKTKKNILKGLATCLIAASLSACVDLEPKAMSFLTPENTFVDKAGLETMLRLCRKQMNFEWFGDAFNSGNCETFSVYEYAWSDLAVMGGPETKEIHNMVTQLTPTTNMYLHLRYWVFGWNGIKYANTVITRAPEADGMASEEDRNACLAEGYFHRAYWYYLLTNQFGDIPWIGEEITGAKLDFNTVSRKTILTKIKADMEYAVQWLPKEVIRGAVSRAAGEHLLAKICLATGDFQQAIDATTRCINNYGLRLMTERFGINSDDKTKDVYNDLFQEENISIVENKEGIMIGQEIYGLDGCSSPSGSRRKRNFVPQWHSGGKMKTPDGKNGTTDASGFTMDMNNWKSWVEVLPRYVLPTMHSMNCGRIAVMICVIIPITGMISHVSNITCLLQRVVVPLISVNRLTRLTVRTLCVAISPSRL